MPKYFQEQQMTEKQREKFSKAMKNLQEIEEQIGKFTEPTKFGYTSTQGMWESDLPESNELTREKFMKVLGIVSNPK